MYTDEDLACAVRAGILSEADAAAFQSHIARLRQTPDVDEEHFRLIGGFNDIFVVIASVLLLAAIGWIGTSAAPWLGAAAQSVAAWGLAEFFTRRRRMALPSILLLLAFVGGILAAGLLLLPNSSASMSVASAAAALAAWLHWRRFRVPITVAAGAAATVGLAVTLLFSLLPETRQWLSAIMFLAGLAVFALAMRWDASDTQRRTRRADAAFWLHLLAAPLLVHPIFSSLQVFGGQTSPGQAVSVLALYIVIALVSLSIDRRALMVSALIYVLYAFSSLLKLYGVISLGFAVTALAIGAALLLLSAFWHASRAAVLGHCPASIRQWLAPLR